MMIKIVIAQPRVIPIRKKAQKTKETLPTKTPE